MYEKLGYLNEKFKLFYLNDKSDKKYEFHYHDFYKIIFFIRGDVNYNIEGKNYELQPYDVVFVGRNEIHRPVVSSETEYERYVLYLSASMFADEPRYRTCFDKATDNHTNVIRMFPNDCSLIMDLLGDVIKRKNTNECFDDLYSLLNVQKILLVLNESIVKNGIEFQGRVQYNNKIVEVCEYINNNLTGDLSTSKLAEIFFISKYYFMHQFKEQTGISVHQYVLEKRIQYTNYLVEHGEKVTQACLMAGFNDYSTFLKASKKRFLAKEKD